MAQWWERSPPTNVARVRFPVSASYMGWVCCWFSSLLREVFLRVLRFSPLLSMYLSFSLHDQDTHLAELWYEGFIKNLFANCRSRVGPSTLLNTGIAGYSWLVYCHRVTVSVRLGLIHSVTPCHCHGEQNEKSYTLRECITTPPRIVTKQRSCPAVRHENTPMYSRQGPDWQTWPFSVGHWKFLPESSHILGISVASIDR